MGVRMAASASAGPGDQAGVRDDVDGDDALGFGAGGGVGDGDFEVVSPDGERGWEFDDLDEVEVAPGGAACFGHCLRGAVPGEEAVFVVVEGERLRELDRDLFAHGDAGLDGVARAGGAGGEAVEFGVDDCTDGSTCDKGGGGVGVVASEGGHACAECGAGDGEGACGGRCVGTAEGGLEVGRSGGVGEEARASLAERGEVGGREGSGERVVGVVERGEDARLRGFDGRECGGVGESRLGAAGRSAEEGRHARGEVCEGVGLGGRGLGWRFGWLSGRGWWVGWCICCCGFA